MATVAASAAPPRPELSPGPPVGRVASISAGRVEVELRPQGPDSRVTVSDLVAFPTGRRLLVAIVTDVARQGPERVRMSATPIGGFDPSAGARGAFRPGSAQLPHVDAPCFLLEGERLKTFMSTLGAGVAPEHRLILGHYAAARETPAIADGDRMFQRHLAVLGNTGAGKSWTVALLLDRAARLQHANVIVLDLHGEYGALCESTDGSPPIARRLRVAGPADLLYGGEETLHVPYWLLEREELLSLVLSDSDQHAADQRLCLGDRIQTLKRAKLAELGENDAVATATADSPVPYRLSHLLDWLQRDEVELIPRHPSGRMDPGPYAGKLGGLISRIEARVADPRYGFIFHPPENTESSEWLISLATRLLSSGPGETGIKVIDLSEVPGTILPMIAGVLARLVYNIQFWMDPAQRTPLCIVCDEAHVYLPAGDLRSPVHRVARDAFEMIAKEGRKYGVCLAVVSQRPSDVSRTILSQCNNFIVMRLTNDRDQDVVSRLVPASLATVTGVLPMLDVGEAVLIGDALMLPIRIQLDRPRTPPASSTLPYWSLWSNKPSSATAIAAGVGALQTQWRGIE